MAQADDGDEVIPLSRWRAVLARARRGDRVAAILDEPDAGALVPSLPVQELYYLLKEVGLEEGQQLLALASPEQTRGFLDFDLWERDQLCAERAEPWFDALCDLGPRELTRRLDVLDPELVARWLQRQVRIYDLSVEEPPEEPEGHFYPTLDRFYLLDVLADGEAGKRVERVIDWLYRADVVHARKHLMAARWELGSDLEEHAYRWRSGRMADLGFLDYYEALEVYRFLDPQSVTVGEGTRERGEAPPTTLPAPLLEGFGKRGFLGQSLSTIDDQAELERLQGGLLLVANHVLSADRTEPGDVAAVTGALERVIAYLGLGLELLGRGDPARGGDALRSVALVRIFRVGLSLTLKLKRAADALCERGHITVVPGKATLLDEPERTIVASLRVPHPVYPRALDGADRRADDDVTARANAKAKATRPFQTLADIAAATRALEEVAAMGLLVREGLGVDSRRFTDEARRRSHPPPEEITFAVVVATLAGNVLLDRPPSLVPLRLADLATLRERALEEGRLRPSARLRVTRAFDERLAEREHAPPPGYAAWLERWLAHLEATLAPAAIAAPALLPTLVTGILVATGEG